MLLNDALLLCALLLEMYSILAIASSAALWINVFMVFIFLWLVFIYNSKEQITSDV